MRRKGITMLFVFLLALGATAVIAQAETLSWNAVTTYTDGTSVGSVPVTYQASWTTSSGLTGLNPLGSPGGSTSKTFNVDTSAMPRGSVVYFTVLATVNGLDSALATSLSWNVPTLSWDVPTLSPSPPANLRMN